LDQRDGGHSVVTTELGALMTKSLYFSRCLEPSKKEPPSKMLNNDKKEQLGTIALLFFSNKHLMGRWGMNAPRC